MLKTQLENMKIGETINFSDNPFYPVKVTRTGTDSFYFEWRKETVNLNDTVKRLRPFGCEIF
jgi:hypothetical protein